MSTRPERGRGRRMVPADADADAEPSQSADTASLSSESAKTERSKTERSKTESAPTASTGKPRSALSGRSTLAIAVVCLLLGLALVMQVRLTLAADRDLRGARQEDLVRILDDLDNQHDLLGKEVDELSDTKDELSSGGDQAEAAQQEAQARLDELGILNGTVAATGPGVTMQVTGPADGLSAEMILTVIQELRAAGAEAIQVGSVRVGLSSAVTANEDGEVAVDGSKLTLPLTVLAIGDPETIATAMGIPGGALASVSYAGAKATLTQSEKVDITALRQPTAPDYAEPAQPS